MDNRCVDLNRSRAWTVGAFLAVIPSYFCLIRFFITSLKWVEGSYERLDWVL